MMDDRQKPNERFTIEQADFEKAREKYRQAIRQLKPLAILEKLPTPPLHRAAYSDRMAWTLANMAKLAYIKFEENDLELERLRYSLQSGWFNLIRTFDKNGTQAFLAKNDEFVVLCFRGTQPDRWEDIQADLKVLKEKTINGKVHAGFRNAFEGVKAEVFAALEQNVGQMPLYITGHSLGAALATVATQELEERFHDQIAACYTFGSPRVGDGRYEKSIKAPFYRIVNTTDIVTLVPFFLGTFVHVGDPRYLGRRKMDGMYPIYRGVPSLRRLLDATIITLGALFRLNPIRPWVGAHDMAEYIEKLEICAEDRNRAGQKSKTA